MRLFFDTEFTGLRKNTTLISLGIITEDNRCFYAKFTDYDKEQVDTWIDDNVLPNIKLSRKLTKQFVVTEVDGTKEEIKEALMKWLDDIGELYYELVGDCCHYDMVLFTDIFGSGFDLPKPICPVCWDINQDLCYSDDIKLQDTFNLDRIELLQGMIEQSYDEIYYGLQPILNLCKANKHNALCDAIITKCLYALM